MTSWTEEKNNTLRFNFAGHIEGGMSGGPVVSALNNKILEWAHYPLCESFFASLECELIDRHSFRRLERRLQRRILASSYLNLARLERMVEGRA